MRYFIYIFLSAVFFISCSKDKFDNKKNNLIGDWSIVRETQTIRADTVYEQGVSPASSISFNSDGTGLEENFLGKFDEFRWVYQYNPEMVVKSVGPREVSGIPVSTTIFYTVETNTSNMQVWTTTTESYNGIVDEYRHTLTLTKQ